MYIDKVFQLDKLDGWYLELMCEKSERVIGFAGDSLNIPQEALKVSIKSDWRHDGTVPSSAVLTCDDL